MRTGGASAAARMLALGDSYTIGEAVAEGERWPARLAGLLRARGIAADDPVIVARTGWTTDELNAGIDASGVIGTFDLVTLSIGVNNQYRGREAANYRAEFRALLARAAAFAGGNPSHVIVVSIPDWSVTPYAEGRNREAISAEIAVFNSVAHEETVRAGARFVDVTPVSRGAASDSALLASDGLHPSGSMYGQWASLVLPVAIELLG